MARVLLVGGYLLLVLGLALWIGVMLARWLGA